MTACYMHNPSEAPPADYEMLLPIGNVIPLCGPCCAWWRADAASGYGEDEPAMQPVRITSLRR